MSHVMGRGAIYVPVIRAVEFYPCTLPVQPLLNTQELTFAPILKPRAA